MSVPVRIFVSYARKDSRWFQEDSLVPWLARSLRKDQVTLWWDSANILPGDEFRGLIETEIDRSAIALLLVSQEFLNSEFIEAVELPRIRARADRGVMMVIPLLLEPCAWEEIEFLSSRQMLPGKPTPLVNYVDRERDWVGVRAEVLAGIRRAVTRFRAEPAAAGTVPEAATPKVAAERPPWNRRWAALLGALSVLAVAGWLYQRKPGAASLSPAESRTTVADTSATEPAALRLARVLVPSGPEVRAIALTPDRTAVAISTLLGGLEVRNVATGNVSWSAIAKPVEGSMVSGPVPFGELAFSSDGHTLFGARFGAHRTAWDARTGAETWSGPFHTGDSPDGKIAFCHNHAVLASAGAVRRVQHNWAYWQTLSSQVILVDDALGRKRLTLGDIKGDLWSLGCSPDGALVVAGTRDLETKTDLLLAWDVPTGALRWRTKVPETVTGLAFSPAANMLAASGNPGRLYDTTNGRLIGSLDRPLDGKALSFTSNGRVLISAFNPLERWDVASRKLIDSIPFQLDFEKAAVSSDGSVIVTGGRDGSVRVWSLDASR